MLNRSLEQRVREELAENSAKQRLILQQEKLASIGQLAAGVAHEINNPIGFIMSNLGTLRLDLEQLTQYLDALERACAQCTPQRQQELARLRERLDLGFVLDDIQPLIAESLEGAERVKQIVQALKDFARPDEQSLQLTDLNDCVSSTITIVRNELKYVATLDLRLAELPVIVCNPQQVNQVIANLLINAAHSIRSHGTISVVTEALGDTVRLTVSDTGHGIEPALLGRIFDPFFTTKDIGRGTGLGLSISYDIVTRHGGTIEVASVPGSGSSFTVTLPVQQEGGGHDDAERL